MFSLIFAWINGWVNNREAGYLRRHRAHYDVTVMRGMGCVTRRPLLGRISWYLLNVVKSLQLIWGSGTKHDNDAIMSAMASQITSLAIVYSTVFSRRRLKKTSKLRVTSLCAGNSTATAEFQAQRASNVENVSIYWRHHGVPKLHRVAVTRLKVSVPGQSS